MAIQPKFQGLLGRCYTFVTMFVLANFMTVNQRVAGSSPAGGATLDKPSEMMAFSLFISQLGVLHLFINLE